MEELWQASVGTADHTGCGVQHSLQFVGRHFRCTRQYCIAVVILHCSSKCATRQTNVRVWPLTRCRVNAEITEVVITSRNWMRWRWSHVNRSSKRTTALLLCSLTRDPVRLHSSISSYHDIVAARSAVGRSPSPVRWPVMRCLTTSETRRSVPTISVRC